MMHLDDFCISTWCLLVYISEALLDVCFWKHIDYECDVVWDIDDRIGYYDEKMKSK